MEYNEIIIKKKTKGGMEGLTCIKVQNNNIHLAFLLKYNYHVCQNRMGT